MCEPGHRTAWMVIGVAWSSAGLAELRADEIVLPPVPPPRPIAAIRADLDPAKPLKARVEALGEATRFAGPKGPLFDVVRQAATSEKAELRAAAVMSLAGGAFLAKTEVPGEVLAALADPDPEVRYQAASGVTLFDVVPERAVPRLLKLADDANVSTRSCVTNALGRLRASTKPVLRALIRMTSDADPLVRHNAAVALWRLDHERSRAVGVWLDTHANSGPVPKDRPATDAEERARFAVVAAASVFHMKSKEEPSALAGALGPHLNGPSPARRRVAAQMVYAGSLQSAAMRSASRSAGVIPKLRKLLDDGDVRTGAWASQALELLEAKE